MPFGTGLGRVFQKKGRSSSHPIGFCGRGAHVDLPSEEQSRRGAFVVAALEAVKRRGEGTSTARIYRQCFELPKKVARSFSFPPHKLFVFRRSQLRIREKNCSFFPIDIAFFPTRGEKEGKKKRKTGKKSTKTPLFRRFLPRFFSRVSFFFSPLRCPCVFSAVGGSGARIFKFRKAHFRRFLYICTTMSPLGDLFWPSKTTPE